MQVRVDASDLAMMGRAFTRAPEIAAEELHGLMTRSTAHLQAETQERTPTVHGTLRASIFGEVQPFANGLGVEGLVGTPLAHALPVELGSKPHHPPVEPLIDWARQKLALSGVEAEKAARAIAWKIARHGTKGAFMFRDAVNANEAQIAADFTNTAQRLVARIGEAGQ